MRRQLFWSVIPFLALIFLLGTNLAYAQTSTQSAPQTQTSTQSPPGTLASITPSQICSNPLVLNPILVNQIPLIVLALIALSISFDVLAIGYIIGKLVPGTQLSAWVRKEYWEIAKSAMLIAGIYAILVFAGSLASSLIVPINSAVLPSYTSTGTPQPTGTLSTPLTTLSLSAQAYLQNVYGCAAASSSGNFANTYGSYFMGLGEGIGILREMRVGYYIPIPIGLIVPEAPTFLLGTSFQPYANKMVLGDIDAGTYESLLNDAISIIILPLYSIVDLEFYLLPLLAFAGLAFLIPMGVIFRSMPFVRGIGGTLIAIGIGIVIVLPAALLFINQPIYNAVVNNYLSPSVCSLNSAPWWYIAVAPTSSSPATATPNQNPQTLPSSLKCAGNNNGFIDAFASDGSIFPAMNGIFEYSVAAVIQWLLFILDLMILFPLVDTIAKSLGGTINISFGKLKVK
ncbi:MAG: hypothetical protein ACREBF_01500 [Candidatus Micrarchaeales archaeon]